MTLGGSFAAGCGFAGAFAWITRRHQGVTPKVEAARRRLIRAIYGDLPLALAITRYYDYLRLEPADVERFAREYEHWQRAEELREPIEDTFGRFLLSTDFFLHDADESRPVRYLRLHDAYLTPCGNPFLRTPTTRSGV